MKASNSWEPRIPIYDHKEYPNAQVTFKRYGKNELGPSSVKMQGASISGPHSPRSIDGNAVHWLRTDPALLVNATSSNEDRRLLEDAFGARLGRMSKTDITALEQVHKLTP